MFNDVATLFYDHVLKSYKDYMAVKNNGVIGHSQDIRAAIGAATALYHFREHLPDALAISFNDIIQECPDYRLTRDVANASKHGTIDRNSPLISNPSALEECVSVTEYHDEMGRYVSAEKTIMVKLDSGTSKDFSEVLRNVVNFWIEHIQANGVLPQLKSFDSPPTGPVSRENSRPLNMVATQGMMFGKKSYRIFRYDYQKKVAVPLNLTNAQVELRFYKPAPIVIDLEIKADGRTFASPLTLNEANTLKVKSLQSDEERRDFVQALPEFRELFSELVHQAKTWQNEVKNGTADLSLLDAPEDQVSAPESVQGKSEGRDSFSFGGFMHVEKLGDSDE